MRGFCISISPLVAKLAVCMNKMLGMFCVEFQNDPSCISTIVEGFPFNPDLPTGTMPIQFVAVLLSALLPLQLLY